MPVGVVHALEVVEVQQQQRAVPVLSHDARVGLGESIVEERAIREAGQGIVQRLVRELGGEHAAPR